MTWLLLVTWFVQGQPPNSYQVEFTSAALCEAAKGKLQADAEAKKIEFAKRSAQYADPKTGLSLVRVPPPPKLSAVCVQKDSIAQEGSPAIAQEGMSCEAWNEASDQPLKIVTEVKDWIVERIRSEGTRLAIQTRNDKEPFSDLRWATDTQLLAELNHWCRERPGDRLGDTFYEVAFILAATKH